MKSHKIQEFASSAQRITVGKEFLITAYKTQLKIKMRANYSYQSAGTNT